MGVSIMGFATKANEPTVINGLEKQFQTTNDKAKIVFDSEITFDKLINRKETNNIIDIYSTENGSVLVLSHELFELFSTWELSNFYDFEYFDICETSMSHRFARFFEGKEILCMNIWDYGSSKKILGDNYLNINQDEDIFSSVFPRQISKFTQQPFHQIDINTIIKRYKYITQNNPIDDKNNADEQLRFNNQTNNKEEKKGFWKRIFDL